MCCLSQPCESDGVLRFVNATGRIVSKAGDKCLAIQPVVGSYPGVAAVPAKAVLSECMALPSNRQQFQFSVRDTLTSELTCSFFC